MTQATCLNLVMEYVPMTLSSIIEMYHERSKSVPDFYIKVSTMVHTYHGRRYPYVLLFAAVCLPMPSFLGVLSWYESDTSRHKAPQLLGGSKDSRSPLVRFWMVCILLPFVGGQQVVSCVFHLAVRRCLQKGPQVLPILSLDTIVLLS